MTTYYITDVTTDETLTVTEENLPTTIAFLKTRLRQKCVEYFSTVKIEQSGTDTAWRTVFDLSDTDEGTYAVFNFFTGMHEPEGTAAEALTRRAQLVEQYVEDVYGTPDTPITNFLTPVEVLP